MVSSPEALIVLVDLLHKTYGKCAGIGGYCKLDKDFCIPPFCCCHLLVGGNERILCSINQKQSYKCRTVEFLVQLGEAC